MNVSTHSAAAVIYFETRGTPPAALPRTTLDACGHALAGIVGDAPGRWRLLVAADDPQQSFAQLLARAQGLRPEVIAGDAADWRASADARLVLYTGERPPAPASLGPGAARWIAVHATDGTRWEAEAGGPWQPLTWLAETLATVGATLADGVESIYARADLLAQSTAPDTRRLGGLLIAVAAICVLLPVVWLLRTPLQLPPMLAAAAGLASPLLVVAFFWWQRWRSMGRSWARARLVAEACRSMLATRSTPMQPVVSSLAVVPALRPLLQKFAAEPKQVTPDWRDAYLRERVDGQHAYYQRERDRALRERQRLSRWSTILMDLALAIGVAGLVVTLHPQAASWLSAVGGSALDVAFGLAGLALPLGLLVTQALRLVGDATRRMARYTQQLLQLDSLRERWANADDAQAIELLRQAEDALLSEVLEWYFQSETGEEFHTIREQRAVAVPPRHSVRRGGGYGGVGPGLARLGAAGAFVVRVVLGRLVWVVVGAAGALLWVGLR